jgi:predicted naringenin-chalcone synthase
MTAPGLDLQIMELMELDRNIFRTSVNFMGCYAAIHALKIADALCKTNEAAKVLVVCTELCTLHFQREATMDNIASSLLFGDGAAAVLLSSDPVPKGLHLTGFYSEVIPKGKRDMAWELSSTGFLMTLSGYVPELIKADFAAVVQRALQKSRQGERDVAHWCIHPGGKRILQAIEQSMDLDSDALMPSYNVLREFGNMSSATILFVLKDLLKGGPKGNIFAAAFGPGLTVETFTASL